MWFENPSNIAIKPSQIADLINFILNQYQKWALSIKNREFQNISNMFFQAKPSHFWFANIRRPEPPCSKEPQRSERCERPSLSHTRLKASVGKPKRNPMGKQYLDEWWLWKSKGKVTTKSNILVIVPKKTLDKWWWFDDRKEEKNTKNSFLSSWVSSYTPRNQVDY